MNTAIKKGLNVQLNVELIGAVKEKAKNEGMRLPKIVELALIAYLKDSNKVVGV